MISTPGGISNLNMRSGKGEFFSSALKVGTGDCQRHRAIPSIPADRYENQAESADRAIRPFFWASFKPFEPVARGLRAQRKIVFKIVAAKQHRQRTRAERLVERCSIT